MNILFQFPYHLHAVLVHEGQAASGHYWAYVYDMVHQKWLKFNDITTSEASWEELEKESVGGYHNASAYCLMYVDKAKLLKQEGGYDTGGTVQIHQLILSDSRPLFLESEDK